MRTVTCMRGTLLTGPDYSAYFLSWGRGSVGSSTGPRPPGRNGSGTEIEMYGRDFRQVEKEGRRSAQGREGGVP
jgi:hypothetical protein